MSDIVLPSGGYRQLKTYQTSEVIYQGTVAFCRRFLPAHGDRTVDQMVQAARSCKQNIAEGSGASGTSKETEIKLTGVARATLAELLEDYQDFLTRHGLAEWPADHPKKSQMREWAKGHNAWSDYAAGFASRDAETLANLMMTVIHQEQALLDGMLSHQEEDFKACGGIRERMTRARHAARAATLDEAVYSRLQQAQTPVQLKRMIAEICRSVQKTGERLAKKNGWGATQS